MAAGSLRLRLLAGAAAWIALALVVAGLVIAYLFTENAERAQRADLSSRLTRIVASIDPQSPALLTTAQPIADPRYDVPLSGAYWQVEAAGGEPVRSRSLWDAVLPAPAADPEGETLRRIPGPDGQSLSALSMLVRFKTADGEKAVRITVGEDRAALDSAQSRFARELALALAVLGCALAAAAWLQVRVGLSPLARLREAIGTLRRTSAERVPGDYPAEVRPLVDEVEELIASQTRSIEFARARASDLAHGLKTPLSVLTTLSDRLREKGDRDSAATIDALTEEMSDRIDYQLRLARLRMRTRSHALSAPLGRAVERSVAVLRKTRDGERLSWTLSVDPGLAVDMDSHDLMELIGVLTENAAKWAETGVSVIATADRAMARLAIADDGPGVDPQAIGWIGRRGQRLDETKPGTGLGLSIAREIVAMNDGRLDFANGADGGLLVTVDLPLASRAEA